MMRALKPASLLIWVLTLWVPLTRSFAPPSLTRVPTTLTIPTSTRLWEGTNDAENETPTKELTPTERIIEQERNPELFKEVDNPNNDRYPIDLPSPLLLASSILLAIVATGSIYQFLGDPQEHIAAAGVALVGAPASLFLFYAAIAKATVETEEDDEQFLKGN